MCVVNMSFTRDEPRTTLVHSKLGSTSKLIAVESIIATLFEVVGLSVRERVSG